LVCDPDLTVQHLFCQVVAADTEAMLSTFFGWQLVRNLFEACNWEAPARAWLLQALPLRLQQSKLIHMPCCKVNAMMLVSSAGAHFVLCSNCAVSYTICIAAKESKAKHNVSVAYVRHCLLRHWPFWTY